MERELRILYPTRIYPETDGGYLRTFNISQLALDTYTNVSIFTADDDIAYKGCRNGINLVQEKKYKHPIEKYYYYLHSLLSPRFHLMCAKSAYNSYDARPGHTTFQIEGPYFYHLLIKKNIKNYILDEHNVYWEFSSFPSSTLKYKIFNGLTSKRNRSIEIEALRNASHVLVCSETDRQKIIRAVPEIGENITVIPNCVNFNEYSNLRRNNADNRYYNVLFMGLLSYSPNIDAVFSICRRIAPRLKDNIRFTIVGKNPPDIRTPKNVSFTGYVHDLKEYIINSDICIAPLRYGSGTRFKILEYMAAGKPVVSTTIGAEGIDYTPNQNILIEDDIDLYADRIRELIDDDKKRESLGNSAKALIKQKYDWRIYRSIINDIYKNVLDER